MNNIQGRVIEVLTRFRDNRNEAYRQGGLNAFIIQRDITMASNLANDVGLTDSLDIAELLLDIQEEFDFDLDDSETQNLTAPASLKTVGDVVRQVSVILQSNGR